MRLRSFPRRIRARRAERQADPVAAELGPPPAPRRADPAPPSWLVSLLVRRDGDWIYPSVQLWGDPPAAGARIRLEVSDPADRTYWAGVRPVRPEDVGTQFDLPPFRPPAGHAVEDVLAWTWHVVGEQDARERVLCSQRLRPMGGLTPEAEIAVTGAGGGDAASPSLYVAGEHARPTPVHGARGAPWWLTPYGTWRLRAEVAAMKARFPEFALTSPTQGTLGWEGRLIGPFGVNLTYAVVVTYPSYFPDEPPQVEIERPPLLPDTPHVVLGNRPCVYLPAQGSVNGYDPGRSTAATLVAWTALWIHAYECWARTGVWPGRAQ